MISFLKSWLFSTHLFDLRLGCRRKSICSCWRHQPRPFLEHKHTWRRLAGWPCPVRLGFWQIVSQRQTELASLQEKQLTEFVASGKIWALKWKLEFRNTCIHHCAVPSFPVGEDVSDEMMGVLMNTVCFYTEEWNVFDIWNICIIQWTDIFKWPIHDIIKSSMGKRSKVGPMDFNIIECEKSWLWFWVDYVFCFLFYSDRLQ